jgi:hypothetical protein
MADAQGRDLARRGEVAKRRGALTVWRAGARSTESISFSGSIYTWADVPRDVQNAVRHGSPVVAEDAGVDGTLYGGRGMPVEVLRAWRAHADRLVVVVLERPVRADGVPYVPVGPWSTRLISVFDGAGPIRRRVGVVPAGVSPVTTGGGESGSPLAPSTPPAAAGAAHAWSYLPAPVRDGAVKAIPLPEDWLGSLTQRHASGLPITQQIVMLRRDTDHALVLHATRGPITSGNRDQRTRALAQAPWTVQQFDLDLRPVRRLSATREPSPWE